MTIIKQTSKDNFKSLQIIYYALIAGQFFFGLVTYILSTMENFNSGGKELRDIFIYIVPVFAVGGFLGSIFIFKNRLQAAKNKADLFDIMADYRSALIVRYALLEGPSFLSIAVYFLTGDIIFLVFSGLIILYFFAIKPTTEKAAIELNLNPSQNNSINDPDKIIAQFKSMN